jgi:hypothetical protein
MTDAILTLGSDNRTALRHLAESLSLPRLEAGWVWLAGAGPSDPGLRRCIRSPRLPMPT